MRRLVFVFCILLLNTSLYAVEKSEIVIREVGIQVVDASTQRILELVIPSGATPEQLEALQKSIEYGAQKGVEVIIHVID